MKILSLLFGLIIFVLVSYGYAEDDVNVGTPDVANNATASENNSSLPSYNMPDWITFQYPAYVATGKLDPFVSFVKIREYELMEAAKKAKKDKKVATPLETVEVHSLSLIGIIKNKDGSTVAMVELPDGKGYLIRTGMVVGLYDGIVTSIGDGMLVVEERVTDVFGETKKRHINLRLRQE